MKSLRFLTYAGTIVFVVIGAVWYVQSYSGSQNNLSISGADVVMYKNAGCQCCDKWASYLERNQLSVNVEEITNLPEIRADNGVSPNMSSCHTAMIDDYVIEGHVPVEDIRRLLNEEPEAIGIAAPGMPKSSPGMNRTLNDPYSVYLIDKDGSTRVFASH